MNFNILFFKDNIGYHSIATTKISSQTCSTIVILTGIVFRMVLDIQELFWKPFNIPLAQSFGILHNQFQSVKVENCNGIERDIEQNKGPFKESINRVGYKELALFKQSLYLNLPPATLCTLC